MRRRSFRLIVVHTFAALALLMASVPAQAGVLWQTSHETGDLSDWSKNGGGGVFNSGTGQMSATTEAAHTGRYAAKMEVWNIDTGTQACRIFRWGEHLTDGYFSAWYMFPVLPQVNNWLNIFEFKKKNYSTGQVDPTWYNEVKNRSRGTILTLTHWNQAWEIPENVQLAAPIEAGKWFHIEWHYKDGISDGAIQIWINGTLVWDLQNVNTRGIDPDIQWAPCLYGTGVMPGHLVMYIDDAAVSTTRVGPGYFSPTPNQSPVASLSASPTSGTAPLAVAFSASGSSDPDGTISSYGWNFGDGTMGSGATVSHTYSAAGTYTATLTVTDNAGASATASTTVTVAAAPVSDPNRYTVDANTVALYHFDGDLKDASPNGLHLSAQGGASVVTDGSGGQVLRTRNLGDQAVVSIPDWRLMPNGNLSPLTLEARIFPRAYKAYSVGNYPIVSLAQDWDTRLEVLDRKWSTMKLPRVEGSKDVVLMDEAAWGSRVTLNAWHVLKITFETNGRASVYVDGVLVGSQTVPMNTKRTSDWALRLGNFDGDIDEVRVSNVARTGVAAKPASADGGSSQEFSLGQNLPNPFNPSTTIRYTLPEASPVRLVVYNALGQEVRVLVDEAQGPGSHSVRWDGRDVSGRSAAAGVYFYRLEAGPRAAVGRMVFAK